MKIEKESIIISKVIADNNKQDAIQTAIDKVCQDSTIEENLLDGLCC